MLKVMLCVFVAFLIIFCILQQWQISALQFSMQQAQEQRAAPHFAPIPQRITGGCHAGTSF